MRLLNAARHWFWLAPAILGIVAAVAAALGCPVFRNPGNYISAGGLVGYLKYVVDVHRKH